MGQHFNLFVRYPDQLVVSNEMGSLEEEVVTVSLAEMEDGEITDHGEDPDRNDLFSVPVVMETNR